MAVGSALAQKHIAAEVRLYDNASSDGTSKAVHDRFPSVQVRTLEENLGACHARNLALRECNTPYVLFLDDDAYFTDPDTAVTAIAFLREHTEVGAVGLPFVEPKQRGMAVWTPPPAYEQSGHCRIRSFVSCACLLRRDPALAIGGFREAFRQWGEERDFCIRMMQAGLAVEFIRAPAMVHLGSAKRDRAAMEQLGVRNTLLFDLLNVPMPWMLARLLSDAFRLFAHKLSFRTLSERFTYVTRALADLRNHRAARCPVSRVIYRQFRTLPAHGPIAAVETVPPPCLSAS